MTFNHDFSPIFSAGLEYIDVYGFAVLPCQQNKKPSTPKGHMSAAKTRDEAIDLFNKTKNFHMLGIRTGVESNLLVLDIDPRDSVNGKTNPMEPLILSFGSDWCETASVQTPSGGTHFYFALSPSGSANWSPPDLGSHNKIFDGVDVKCNGGYVIAPPSCALHGSYEWQFNYFGNIPSSLKLLPVPEWIGVLVKGLSKSALVFDNFDQELLKEFAGFQCDFPLLRTVLRDSARKVHLAKEGTRGHTLSKQAYSLGHWIPFGLSAELAIECLTNITWGWSDFDPLEASRKIRSGLRDGMLNAEKVGNQAIPEAAKAKWKEHKRMMEFREKWRASLTDIPDGVTLEEILAVKVGWSKGFQGQRKAALNFLAKELTAGGYWTQRNRRNGVRAERWYRKKL